MRQGWSSIHQAATMDGWAVAAPANSELMRRWMTEFRLAYKVGPGTYCENLQDEVVGAGLRPLLPNLAMHAAYRVATSQFPQGSVAYKPPSTDATQPYGWLQKVLACPPAHPTARRFEQVASPHSTFAKTR